MTEISVNEQLKIIDALESSGYSPNLVESVMSTVTNPHDPENVCFSDVNELMNYLNS